MFLCFQVIPPEEGNVGAKSSRKRTQQKRTKTLGQPTETFGAHCRARSKTSFPTARKFKIRRESSRFIKKHSRMRTTRQSSTAPVKSEGLTLQQVMEMMQGLQETMTASRTEQECIQMDVAVSQARNEELHRTNEELRRGLRNQVGSRETDEQECVTPPREFPMPFSQAIMDAVIPSTFVGPKATFTGMEDPEAHLTAFHTQMMVVDGSDAMRCKVFMSMLVGTTMDWFISLPDSHVTSFAQLS